MKYISTLVMGLATVASLCLTSCDNSDDAPEEYSTAHIEEQAFTIDPNTAAVEKPTVTFEASEAWTLYSDEIWCQLERDGVKRNSLSGVAGRYNVKVVVNASQAEDKERTAVLRLKVGTNTFTVATVTLGKLAYRGLITIDGVDYRSKDGVPVPLFESGAAAVISANYDFVLRMPSWCLANGSISMEGKSGVEYPVLFTFNNEAGVDQRYSVRGEVEMMSPDGTITDTFPITFLGMDKYKTEIEIAHGPHNELLTPWNWVADPDAKTFSHLDSQNNEVVLSAGIPFNVYCRDDKVQFVFVVRDGNTYTFSPAADYAEVKGTEGHYTLLLTGRGDMPASCMLMAFAEAAWDTIKADPAAALLEYDADLDIDVVRYVVQNNNLALDWTRRVVNNSPFIVHHTRLYTPDYTDFRHYELTKTSAYLSIFGTDDVWEMSIDPSDVNLCIEFDGYETMWYPSLRIGFDRKLDIPLDDIAENGSCDWRKAERPAFKLYLDAGQRSQLAQGPLYVAIINPTNNKVTGLVIKAE